MPKPFDVTTKFLIELSPGDWLEYAGLPTGEVELINANLETVIAEADKVMRVDSVYPYIAHFELQASFDPTILMRLLKYNVLLRERHSFPVRSVLLLLRPESDHPSITGELRFDEPDKECLVFRYRVVRAWQQPVGAVLRGGLGALPLAPLADLSGHSVASVVRKMADRISAEAAPGYAADLWASTYFLMGLRYNESVASQVLKGVRAMRESVTYQATVNEGKAVEARRALFIVGGPLLGAPSDHIRHAVEGTEDIDRLEGMLAKVAIVKSWDELLQ